MPKTKTILVSTATHKALSAWAKAAGMKVGALADRILANWVKEIKESPK